jgi:multidrug efflux pump subunit AcrB
VLVLIYVLMVGWFRVVPRRRWSSWRRFPSRSSASCRPTAAMGAFFTATSMIGFMAGAGIVVRNSIILVDFIELRLGRHAAGRGGGGRRRGALPSDAADRRRSWSAPAVILFDPIFQGLAISLMAGEVASLLISRMAVPVLYYMAYSRAKS